MSITDSSSSEVLKLKIVINAQGQMPGVDREGHNSLTSAGNGTAFALADGAQFVNAELAGDSRVLLYIPSWVSEPA